MYKLTTELIVMAAEMIPSDLLTRGVHHCFSCTVCDRHVMHPTPVSRCNPKLTVHVWLEPPFDIRHVYLEEWEVGFISAQEYAQMNQSQASHEGVDECEGKVIDQGSDFQLIQHTPRHTPRCPGLYPRDHPHQEGAGQWRPCSPGK